MVAARDLPSCRTMAENILDALARATADDWLYGVSWYPQAHAYATHLADEFGITVEQAAAVIAVLSPRVEWEENRDLARRALQAWADGHPIAVGLTNNCERAERNLADPTCADVKRSHRTLKVNSFYRNIMGDESCATIDRHALRTALGDHSLPESAPSTDAAYRALSDAYVLAAADADLPTSMLQAIVWSVCRRERKDATRATAHVAL